VCGRLLGRRIYKAPRTGVPLPSTPHRNCRVGYNLYKYLRVVGWSPWVLCKKGGFATKKNEACPCDRPSFGLDRDKRWGSGRGAWARTGAGPCARLGRIPRRQTAPQPPSIAFHSRQGGPLGCPMRCCAAKPFRDPRNPPPPNNRAGGSVFGINFWTSGGRGLG